MAAITATYWTSVITARTIQNKEKRNRITMTLSATQTGTYPTTGGIPLPTTPGFYGMVRNTSHIIFYGHGTSTQGQTSILWQYSATTNALRGYWAPATAVAGVTGFPELPTTWEPSQGPNHNIFYVEAVGW